MPIQFKFDTTKLVNNSLKWLEKWMRKSVDELFIEVNRLSPVDTWKYQKWHKKHPVSIQGNQIIGKISNEGEYPDKVEEGWRKTEVNWHTPAWIYRDVGANTYRRALERKKSSIINNLKQWG